MIDFSGEVEAALTILRKGGTILYPTDTIWGLGCDATDEKAVQQIFTIKQRPDSKSLIILVADEREIFHYVAAPEPAVFEFMAAQQRPTTVIFDGAIHLPDALVPEDGSIAIRIVKDEFCRHLIKRLRKPLVSTSANRSGEPSPKQFGEITNGIRSSVDYIVNWRQQDDTPSLPSQIIKWGKNGYEVIRS